MGNVYSDELISFIELVAELEGGEDAVDTIAVQIAANKIMKTQESITTESQYTDKGINEKQFLDM